MSKQLRDVFKCLLTSWNTRTLFKSSRHSCSNESSQFIVFLCWFWSNWYQCSYIINPTNSNNHIQLKKKVFPFLGLLSWVLQSFCESNKKLLQNFYRITIKLKMHFQMGFHCCFDLQFAKYCKVYSQGVNVIIGFS